MMENSFQHSGVTTRRGKRLSDEGLPASMKRVALGDITNKTALEQPRRSERLSKNNCVPIVTKKKNDPSSSATLNIPSSSDSSNPFNYPTSFSFHPTNSTSNTTFKFSIQPTSASQHHVLPPPIATLSHITTHGPDAAPSTQTTYPNAQQAPVITQHSAASGPAAPGVESDAYWAAVAHFNIDVPDPSQLEAQANDPQLCTVYAEDISSYLRTVERKHQPFRAKDYMRSQTDITPHMRMILVDWLVEVADEYKLSTETLYLCVNYADRYLGRRTISRGNLQLLGVACMLIASKYEEIYPPSVEDFVYIADNTYTREQVFQMESQVLDVLQFVLTVATPKVFLRRFQRAAGADATATYLSNYLCELGLTEYRMNQFLPSVLAAASVYLALHTMRKTPWSTTLEYYSRHRLVDPEFQRCIRELHQLHRSPIKEHMRAIYDKFSHESHLNIARAVRPATSLPF